MDKQNYRLFLDDIKTAHKKIKRTYPKVPNFRDKDEESITDISFDN